MLLLLHELVLELVDIVVVVSMAAIEMVDGLELGVVPVTVAVGLLLAVVAA